MSNIIWIILIGFVAGLIARMLSPGPNDPKGFILTTVLGIAGAFFATFIGQTVGWYRLDQGAGLIGATIGALVVYLSGTGWSPTTSLAIQATPALLRHVADRDLATFRVRRRHSKSNWRLIWDCSTS